MEDTQFVGAHLITSSAHEFTQEEIDYIEQNGTTIAAVREAIGKVPEGQVGGGISVDALIGEAVSQANQPTGTVEPNVIDPTDPANEGKDLGEAGAEPAND